MKISHKFILFFSIINLILLNYIPSVNASTTETVLVYRTGGGSITEGGGFCVWGWDGIVCPEFEDIVDGRIGFTVVPPSYTIDGIPITNWELINASIVTITVSPESNINTIEFQLQNYTGWLGLDEDRVYDYDLLTNYPTEKNWSIYNSTFTEYLAVNTLGNLPNFDSDLGTSGTPIYFFSMLVNIDGINPVEWSRYMEVAFFIDITYETGGWDSFTPSMMSFISNGLIVIVLLWVFGKNYGIIGGGLAFILGGIIVLMSSDVYTLAFIYFGFGLLFFLIAKKNNGRNGGMVE